MGIAGTTTDCTTYTGTGTGTEFGQQCYVYCSEPGYQTSKKLALTCGDGGLYDHVKDGTLANFKCDECDPIPHWCVVWAPASRSRYSNTAC